MEYANKVKLLRARKLAEQAGKADDENAIRELYLSIGGLITGEEEVGTEEVVAPKKSRKAKTEEAKD